MSEDGVIELRQIKEASISLRTDGIVHVHYNEGVEINPELQLRLMEIFRELCGSTKRPFLFSAMEYVTVTKEGRANAIAMEPIFPGVASAVVAHNTAYRLIANFYLQVNKPKTPYKVFSTQEKAIEWLHTFMDKK